VCVGGGGSNSQPLLAQILSKHIIIIIIIIIVPSTSRRSNCDGGVSIPSIGGFGRASRVCCPARVGETRAASAACESVGRAQARVLLGGGGRLGERMQGTLITLTADEPWL
jgi:hypothetical protein